MPAIAALNEEQRQLAMKRFAVIQPHLEDNVPLARAARDAGVSIRTAERWLARYRRSGLMGLVRSARSDADVTAWRTVGLCFATNQFCALK
jgi:putative transposase